MDWTSFDAALEEGALVITANRRLAADLRARFDDARVSRGLAAWPSPDLLPYGAWITRCWEAALPALPVNRGHVPVPLSLTQAQWVWERIGRQPNLAGPLLFPNDTILRAYEAWRWLQEWRLPLPASADTVTPEEGLFLRWAQAYAAHLDRAGWIDPHQMAERLLPVLEAGAVSLPGRVLLAGFDDHPPVRIAVWEALRSAGIVVEEAALDALTGQALRVTLDDVESEALAAARWARQRLEHNPAARVGIVVPDLAAQRGRLARVFADVLAPGILLGPANERGLPFNITKAPTLAEAPLAAAAEAILRITPGRQPETFWRSLLLSPFIGGAEQEADARATLELRLRRRAPALAPGTVQRLALGEPTEGPTVGTMNAANTDDGSAPSGGDAPRTVPPAAPILAGLLARWREAFEQPVSPNHPHRGLPSEWAAHFGTLLDAWGWPGERTPDSAEYQTREKFEAVGREFAAMDPFTEPVPLGEARMLLGRLLDGEEFQPEGGPASVQIMGALEAGGLTFDYLWVMGLHHDAWPPAPRPNPFLPLGLQRQHGMPHASITRELELARRQTARLCASAPEVVLSHPRLDGERELRPSPLIEHLPIVEPGALPASDASLRRVIAAAAAVETFDDPTGPPLPPGTQPRGGTSLFRNQAACPFRAFAAHRLHAKPIEEAGAGPNAADRGVLVHRVLDLAWRRLKNHAALMALDEPALAALCAEVVSQALTETYETRPDLAGEALRGLEQTRLGRLLSDWLTQERARPPFEVEALEAERACDLGGISVTGRVDRIDRLPDGRRIVLDYKTGKTTPGSWFGERPDEPQLPIYCTSESTPPAGVAFARLRKGELGFSGLASDAAILPGTRNIAGYMDRHLPDVSPGQDRPAQLVSVWTRNLAALGEAFRAGEARVDPKRPPGTCAYCGLEALCRIAETPGGAVRRDEDAPEENGGGDNHA